MNCLVIQTNLTGERHLWLTSVTGRILKQQHARHEHHAAHLLLKNIARLIGPKKVGQIVVIRGPGPFTAIRAALVTANTLGWIWNIPVSGVVRHSQLTAKELAFPGPRIGKKFGRPIRPWYGRGPNITIAKPRQKSMQFSRRR